MRVLIADDDADIRELLRILLASNQYEVIEAADGEEAVRLADASVDLYLLDVRMPGMDGYAACSKIREVSRAPVVFLTAKGQEYDKVAGFSAGGDDYIVKPFKPLELLSRVNAHLRRWHEYGGNTATRPRRIVIGDLVIDEDACGVTVRGEERRLTAIEFRLLLLMAKTRGKVFSAQNLYESVWDEPYFYTANNTVMVHIRRLREKIEDDPRQPRYVKTVWGMGYRLEQ